MSRGGQAVTIAIVFTGLAFAFVLVRCLTRFFLIRKAGPEDVLVTSALIFSIGLTICINYQKEYGLGQHKNSITPSSMEDMLKAFYASIFVYYAGLTATKVSILLQFLRFFVVKLYRQLCWFFIVFFISYGSAAMVTSAFSCWPVDYFWDKSIGDGRCIDLLAFWFTMAGLNIFSDLVICILPIPSLKALQLPKKEKSALMLVFAFGGFGCITSILRLHSLYIIAISTDVTWDNVGAATWSSVELNVGIMCACLPTIKPLLNWLFPNHFTHSHRSATIELPQGSPYPRHSTATDISRVEKAHINTQVSDFGDHHTGQQDEEHQQQPQHQGFDFGFNDQKFQHDDHGEETAFTHISVFQDEHQHPWDSSRHSYEVRVFSR